MELIAQPAVALTVSALLMISACSKTIIIPGEGPVKSINISGHWLTVTPNQDARLSDLTDMSFFEGFTPEMNFEEATRTHGQPQNASKKGGELCIEYWKAWGRAEVCIEEVASGPFWSLVAYPNTIPPRLLLSPFIIKHLNRDIKGVAVDASDDTGKKSTVFIDLNGGRVERIYWRGY